MRKELRGRIRGKKRKDFEKINIREKGNNKKLRKFIEVTRKKL